MKTYFFSKDDLSKLEISEKEILDKYNTAALFSYSGKKGLILEESDLDDFLFAKNLELKGVHTANWQNLYLPTISKIPVTNSEKIIIRNTSRPDEVSIITKTLENQLLDKPEFPFKKIIFENKGGCSRKPKENIPTDTLVIYCFSAIQGDHSRPNVAQLFGYNLACSAPVFGPTSSSEKIFISSEGYAVAELVNKQFFYIFYSLVLTQNDDCQIFIKICQELLNYLKTKDNHNNSQEIFKILKMEIGKDRKELLTQLKSYQEIKTEKDWIENELAIVDKQIEEAKIKWQERINKVKATPAIKEIEFLINEIIQIETNKIPIAGPNETTIELDPLLIIIQPDLVEFFYLENKNPVNGPNISNGRLINAWQLFCCLEPLLEEAKIDEIVETVLNYLTTIDWEDHFALNWLHKQKK